MGILIFTILAAFFFGLAYYIDNATDLTPEQGFGVMLLAIIPFIIGPALRR